MQLQEGNNVNLGDKEVEVSPPKRGFFSSIKNKMIVMIVGLIAIGTLSYFFYQRVEKVKIEETKTTEKQQANSIYHNIEPIIVNLYTDSKKSKFLKISISLVLKDTESLVAVKELEPTIRDTYFVYLRQLRPDDVNGPVAIYKLREALLKRTNKIIYPNHVKDLLFHEILVQ